MNVNKNICLYFHYQPIDWKIGNYQLGTRDDFISMCKKAKEYGLGVIVDVLPNHTTPRTKKISAEFIEAVGGIEKLYHKIMTTESVIIMTEKSVLLRKWAGFPM